MNTINIIIPEVYKNFDVINVSGGTLTFDALNKSFRNYQTTISGNFQLSILSPKPGGDYKLLVTKNTAADVVVSLPINSVLIGDPTGSTITLSGGIGEQFLIEFSYDGINFLFILGGGSTVEPGASSGFSPNVIPFINSSSEWSEDANFNYINGNLGVGITTPTAIIHVQNDTNDKYLFSLDRGIHKSLSYRIGNNFTDRLIFHNPSNGLGNPNNEIGTLTIANVQGRGVFTITGSEPSGNPSGLTGAIRFQSAGNVDGAQASFIFNTLTHRNYNTFAGQSVLRILGNATGAVGSSSVTFLEVRPTINQTGTSSGQNIGIQYNPTITSILGAHYGLLIRPSGTLNGIGHTTNLPTATWHVKGDSDSVGSVFIAENLSNTARYNLENNGIHNLNFGSGGKVLVGGAVGAGETLLEIRRTLSSSGGFIFSSANSASQSLATTNGALSILTPDNSNINLSVGTGIITMNTSPNMSDINTGQRVMIGTFSSSSLSRWLNLGYNTTFGQIIQANENGSTPVGGLLSINPYGGTTHIVNKTLIGGNTTGIEHIIAGGSGTILRIGRGAATSPTGVTFSQVTGGSGVFNIAHTDTTNTGGNGNINIEAGNGYTQLSGAITRLRVTIGSFDTFSDINKIQLGSIHTYLAINGSSAGSGSTTDPVKIQAKTTNGGTNPANLYINPFGGNVVIGGNITPTATLHVKGNSDTVGEAFRVESLTGNRLIIGNDGKHAINTTVDANFNLKIVGDSGFLYQNTAGTRYIRFRPLIDGDGSEPLDIRTNNTGGNSNILFVRDQGGGVRFKLATASGAGTYLAVGASISESPFGYTAAGIRVHGATLVQGLHNTSNFVWNRFAAVGISAHGDFGTGTTKQSALSIQSFHTNTDISKQVSMLRLHADTTFTLTTGSTNGIVRGIDIDYTINQTGGGTRFIGIDYNPTLTSILGAHYGLLIRPNTLNGIGLGSTLPTALLDLEGSTTARASLRIRTGVAPTAPNDGDIWNDGTDLFVRLGGVTYTLQKI